MNTMEKLKLLDELFALKYLKRFFRDVVNGRRDDENLQPMTIGITTNHLKKSIEEINLQHKTK